MRQRCHGQWGGQGRALYPKICGEVWLLWMELPKGREEPVPSRAPDKGIGMVEVSGVDREEVCVPDDQRGERGVPTPPTVTSFRKSAEAFAPPPPPPQWLVWRTQPWRPAR